MLKTLTLSTSRQRHRQQFPATGLRFLSTPRNHRVKNYIKAGKRTCLHPERTEGTQSGTDNEIAESWWSYDPAKTTPEIELRVSEAESKLSGRRAGPLNVSGANKEVGRAPDQRRQGPDRNQPKSGPSLRGVTKKNRAVNMDKLRAGDADKTQTKNAGRS